jgi:hypothetical protein
VRTTSQPLRRRKLSQNDPKCSPPVPGCPRLALQPLLACMMATSLTRVRSPDHAGNRGRRSSGTDAHRGERWVPCPFCTSTALRAAGSHARRCGAYAMDIYLPCAILIRMARGTVVNLGGYDVPATIPHLHFGTPGRAGHKRNSHKHQVQFQSFKTRATRRTPLCNYLSRSRVSVKSSSKASAHSSSGGISSSM